MGDLERERRLAARVLRDLAAIHARNAHLSEEEVALVCVACGEEYVDESTTDRLLSTSAGDRWPRGPVPFGCDLDDDRRLRPSHRPVPELGTTESGLVRDLYRLVDAGSSPEAEARRLNALGVPAPTRYAGDEEPRRTGPWRPSRLLKMLRSRVYRDLVVDAGTWDHVARRLAPTGQHKAPRADPLRGLVTCGVCTSPWLARSEAPRLDGTRRRIYACAVRMMTGAYPGRDCTARAIPAEFLEREVWRLLALGGEPTRAAVERVALGVIVHQVGEPDAPIAAVVVTMRAGGTRGTLYRYPQRRLGLPTARRSRATPPAPPAPPP